MMGFRVAVQFLTRLPVRTETLTAPRIASSYYFYPAIGFAIGLAAAILRRALTLIFPDSFSIVIILGFLVWVTGGNIKVKARRRMATASPMANPIAG